MSYRGHVRNGVVVLDEPAALPEGATVEVEEVESLNEQGSKRTDPTLHECLKSVIGKAQGLPPDASRNKYHYLYGRPKA